MQIRVRVSNNVNGKTYNVDSGTTLRDVINTAQNDGLKFANETVQINGTNLDDRDLDRTFESFGYTGEPGHESVFLIGVVNKKNA